jgi:hypothetical protein
VPAFSAHIQRKPTAAAAAAAATAGDMAGLQARKVYLYFNFINCANLKSHITVLSVQMMPISDNNNSG